MDLWGLNITQYQISDYDNTTDDVAYIFTQNPYISVYMDHWNATKAVFTSFNFSCYENDEEDWFNLEYCYY